MSNTCMSMPAGHPSLRLMQPDDIDGVIAVQHACYGEQFHESSAAFLAKLSASPASCWVMGRPGEVQAYLVCLPVQGAQLPGLHAETCPSTTHPEWLYVHDLAISPQARGRGLASPLLEAAFQLAADAGLPTVGLVAVQGAAPFWARHGFHPAPHDSALVPADKLASFGKQATFMVRHTQAI